MYRYETAIYRQKGNRSEVVNRRNHFSRSKKRPKTNVKLKRFRGSIEELDLLVLNEARRIAAHANRFCAEDVGINLGIKVDQVHHSCHRLNLKGFVSRRYKDTVHDTNRDHWGGNASGWAASVYVLQPKALSE
jgi:hypothetical protein